MMNTPFLHRIIPIFCILSLAVSCNKKSAEANGTNDDTPPLFTLMAADSSGFDFTNTVVNQKDFNIFKYRNFYNGGGVAIGDINNDGLPDIYMVANQGPNKLFLNKGNMTFEDITQQAGVAGNKPWSTGVTMVDINADGLLDIYVSNAGNMEGNNHDNDLYINNGDLTFTEEAATYNLAKTGFTTHASFFDYDKDGDLDAYILNNSNIPVSSLGYAHQRDVRAQDWEGVPDIFKGVGDMLLRNDDGVFTDVSEEAGIYGSLIGFGLGVQVTDFNKDGYPDIYVSNDFYERDYLYINQKDGSFSEEIKERTGHLCLSAMGVDIADINNDGHNDIFITDMMPEPEERVKSVMTFEGYNVFKLKQSKDFFQQYIQNTLQLNNGDGTFSEIAHYSGVAKTDWSWAGLMFDMDNDGYRDIFVTNGVNHDLTDLDFVDFFANDIIQRMALTGKKEAIDTIINKMPRVPIPNYAFRNTGDLRFDNVSDNWGLGQASMSNGCAYADLDNDGDLDMVVNNVNMPSFLYRNESKSQNNNRYLSVTLKGDGKNPFAVGSTVMAYAHGSVYQAELIPSRGFQSSVDYRIHLGLGDVEVLDSLRIIWPDDRTLKVTGVATNQKLTFSKEEATDTFAYPQPEKETPLLTSVTSNFESHKEDVYNDFDYEGLIYQQLSREGPALAVSDVNGDGLDDVFVGGAAGSEGKLYLQNANGSWKASEGNAFALDAFQEDTSALFADVNGDGYPDLIVGSGGNRTGENQSYKARLYLNDGKGLFTSGSSLPSAQTNISSITAHDFDKDGDTDLFIASRSVTGQYGLDPKHLVLTNDGKGNFSELSVQATEEIQKAGMITEALWSDQNGDGEAELVTVSEWGTPKIFSYTNGRFEKVSASLDTLKGWWTAVYAEDVNGDGKQDLILGNRGENIPYLPTPTTPLKMFVNDYDNNSTVEQVFTWGKDGKDYPLHMKKEITAQIVSLKKENLKSSDYAQRTIEELFSEEVLDRSIVREITTSTSAIALNTGNGNYEIQPLPAQVQWSDIHSITMTDVDGDGRKDLIMGGNQFNFKPQYSRLDASFGHVLLSAGDGQFTYLPYSKSGLRIRGEIRGLQILKGAGDALYLIAGVNNESPKLYQIRAN